MSLRSTDMRPVSTDVVLVEPALRGGHGSAAPWWLFGREVLAHAGVTFAVVDRVPETLAGVGTLLFVAAPRLDTDEIARVGGWVGTGGVVVTVGGSGDLSALVPVSDGEVLGLGTRVRLHEHQPGTVPVFGGAALRVTDADVRVTADDDAGRVVACTAALGKGTIHVWGADLWQTVVRILQGWPVETDGTPAGDGSMPVDDGVLKCDDGIALDLVLDRRVPPGQPEAPDPYAYAFPPEVSPPVFDVPVADVWRTAFVRTLTGPSGEAALGVPFVEYWPNGETSVVHISQDADGNQPKEAAAAIELWRELDVRTTWCMLFPGGYGDDLLAQIVRDGHEVALHFSALGDTDISHWGFEELKAQLAWLTAWSGGMPVVTNKNHYTRWEGWSQFFEWCELLGIQLDQTRGPSKLGGVGFPFGSAHLWRPLKDGAGDGRLVDVLAMPLHTQDLGLAAHESIRDVILDGADEHGGVAHFLFHPMHIRERELVRGTCRRLVAEIRRRGLRVMTARDINAWERSRREVDVCVVDRSADALDLSISGPAGLSATVGIPIAEPGSFVVTVDGREVEAVAVPRRRLQILQVPVELGVAHVPVLIRVRRSG